MKDSADSCATTEQCLVDENGDTIKIFGYADCPNKGFFTCLGMILTFGILKVIFYWFPKLEVTLSNRKQDFRSSDKILVEDAYKGKWKSYEIVNIEFIEHGTEITYYLDGNRQKVSKSINIFKYKSVVYVLEGQIFAKLQGLGDNLPSIQIHANPGRPKNQQTAMLSVYGRNEIIVPLNGILELTLREILTPFYIFQIFSFIVWLCDEDFTFAFIIIGFTAFGVIGQVYETRKNQKKLRQKVRSKEMINVYRMGYDCPENISTSDLVPGDIVELTHGHIYCDAIILSGSCLVDESMLTGESIPVLKTALPRSNYTFIEVESVGHVVYAGTDIIQQEKVKALVWRTGFLTSKGNLIRSIMYPAPVDYAFDKDCTKCCIVMFLVGLFGAGYTVFGKMSRGIPMFEVVIKSLGSLTILLPAMLPVALTIGKLYAFNRLMKSRIFTTNSNIINVAGTVNCICLDKTGTITSNQLEFLGAVTSESIDYIEIRKRPELLMAMSVTHSLVNLNNTMIGDPIDVEMFKATGSSLVDSEHILVDDQTISIKRHYHFVSNLQRMSVIVKTSNGDLHLYSKGSAEVLLNLCIIPQEELANLQKILKDLARKGCRILAIGMKNFGKSTEEILDYKREDLEKDLRFLALLVFENKLKPESRKVIEELKTSGIPVKMITGDNIETALYIAEQSAIVTSMDQVHQIKVEDVRQRNFNWDSSSLALTGPVWQSLLLESPKEDLNRILVKTAVFARILSHQKQQIVDQLQQLEYNVLMCGDGTNDCGALKTALVGLSLAESSEASMAAPLTSQNDDLNCILEVLKEGRAALVTIFCIFKILVASNFIYYALFMILAEIDSNFSDHQISYLDFHMFLYSAFVGNAKAFDGTLHHSTPESSLLSLINLVSLAGTAGPTCLFTFLGFHLLRGREWFEPFVRNPNDPHNYYSYENYVAFALSMYQFTILSAVFSKGKPFRKTIWTNWPLILFMVIITTFDIIISLTYWPIILNFFKLRAPPEVSFRLLLLGLTFANLIITLVIENFVIDYYLAQKVLPKFKKPKLFEKVQNKHNYDKPQLGEVKFDNLGFA